MAIPYHIRFLFILLFSFSVVHAQDTLRLNREQCEAILLKENFTLLAQQLEISQSEAQVIQAKLWPNPTLELDEINLWTSQKGTNNLSYFGDELPPLAGNFGRNQQISISLEQVIKTAGKRKKLVALEQVNVDKSRQYFEDVIRNLKLEFRKQLTQLQYQELLKNTYSRQLSSIRQLTKAYQHQVEQGHLPKGEYIRLKALELEISREIHTINSIINEVQTELKVLMHLPPDVTLQLTPEGFFVDTEIYQSVNASSLLEEAQNYRPDLKLAELEITFQDKLYTYERAQRMPDITLKGGYDRGGNFMYNFIGFGLSVDLPFFNRNQGNIRQAEFGREIATIQFRHLNNKIENEIILCYRNLMNTVEFTNTIDPGFETILDDLLTGYTQNFSNRNISLLEYLDFLDSYLENKQIIFETGKELHEKTEELNYALGKDLVK